ncbi:acyl-CoA dehydrogenase [Lentzea tibetensis]|uniref:Acyl-CoA dehydrogenase n=1 Tax=Lentzea tibetensis TaxID=2591470 RepID=A0A563EMJ4_9PSEU|nr:acyl-CoA dehydrogenase [Lentzea tibetensis]TWP48344.1 acyl-CoA dehydrogenase [Lentzea tibetensis]
MTSTLAPAELVTRAREMRPRLLDRQALTDELTRVPEETHLDCLDAELYRMLLPRSFGGLETSLRTFVEVVIEISRGCPSTGWNLALAAGHSHTIAALFPLSAQREIFGSGDFRAAMPVAPTGTAVRSGDGYVVNGRWGYASGVMVSTHVIAGVLIDGVPGIACVPEFEVLEDWDRALGMRGSGSNSVVVSDVHVPADWVLPGFVLDWEATGEAVHGNPMYGGRLMTFFQLELTPVVVGCAFAALDEYRRIVSSKRLIQPPHQPRREHPEYQRILGVATGLAESASRTVLSVADDYRSGMSLADDYRLAVVCNQAGQLAAQAVEMLAAASGTASVLAGQRMQRYLRDVQMYRTHSNAQVGNWAATFGRLDLGLPLSF